MRFILVHGYKSSPELNFWPWLGVALRAAGHTVIAPALPEPETPDRDLWTKTLLEAVGPMSNQDIVVGHSLGGASALRLLESAEARTTPHACVLISTPWMILDERFKPFFLSELDYDVLMWRASKFLVIHALDDQIIPLDHANRYASIFHARLVTPATGGHFQGAEYPGILEELLLLANTPVEYAPGETLPNEYSDLFR